MSATVRRIVYVLSYEAIAVIMTSLGLVALGHGSAGSTLVAVVSSAVALIWNYLWTTLFEAWEQRQVSTTRTVWRRVAHAMGFEGGLVVILVPILAWILSISLFEALVLEAGLLVFFLVYTFVFAWVFDRLVPRPQPVRM